VTGPADPPKRREEAVAKRALSHRGKGSLSVHPLMELARRSAPPTPMGNGEVVEDEQVAWPQGKLSLDRLDIQLQRFEEAQLGSQIVELQSAQKAGPVGLPIGDQLRENRCMVRPKPLAQQSVQRHQPRDRRDAAHRARYEERRVPGNILIAQGAQGNPKVEVERLEVTGRLAIRRRQDEVADHAEWVVTI
jgi:hypothetical protein